MKETPERHRRRKALFLAALEIDPGDRAARLREKCADDPELAEELLRMLEVHEQDELPLDRGVGAPEAASEHPAQLGPFRILRQLGEGGMGSVYEAEQERPLRRVALKVLHPGFGTPMLLRRFELEAEYLGRLQHPGIARVYEVGSSDTERGQQAWFAMELVDGPTLTRFCRNRELPLEERIELIAQVADAVQHAHQRGVIHRDLKPGNVLVDAEGRPKVLDFGIARVTDEERGQATLVTTHGTIVGTLEYMSPEQASGDPNRIDVRSDVYALGALLYELIAGEPPLVLRQLAMPEALRRIAEQEPAPLRNTAARPPFDVAVIAHKALAKEPGQRYPSAAEFAEDLRRFLRREPIHALPPSTLYRARRFALRHKALVGGTIATLLALCVGLGAALQQRDRAQDAAERARAINEFLIEGVLASPAPERLGRDAKIVDALQVAERSTEQDFADRPRLAAEILGTIGRSYQALGLTKEAEATLRRAVQLLEGDLEHRTLIVLQSALAGVLTELERLEEAHELASAALRASEERFGARAPESLDCRRQYLQTEFRRGDPQAVLVRLRELIGVHEEQLGPDHPKTLDLRVMMAGLVADQGEMQEAREILLDARERQREHLGREHPATLRTEVYLGWMFTRESAWKEADALYRELVPVMARTFGEAHPHTTDARATHARALLGLGRESEAVVLLRRAVQDFEARYGPDNTWTRQAKGQLAKALSRTGRHEDAIRICEEIRDSLKTSADLRARADSEIVLGECYQHARRAEDAIGAYARAAALYRQLPLDPNDFLAQALFNLGTVQSNAGRAEAAVVSLREALEIDTKTWGAEHRHVVVDRYTLALAMQRAGHVHEALPEIRRVVADAAKSGIPEHRQHAYRALLGELLVACGEKDEGARVLREALRGFESVGANDAWEAESARAVLRQLGR